jgi:hypothetical protein
MVPKCWSRWRMSENSCERRNPCLTYRTASSSCEMTTSGWALRVVPIRVCPLREYPMKKQKRSSSEKSGFRRALSAEEA